MLHGSCFLRDRSSRKVRLYNLSSCFCISLVYFITRNWKKITYLFLSLLWHLLVRAGRMFVLFCNFWSRKSDAAKEDCFENSAWECSAGQSVVSYEVNWREKWKTTLPSSCGMINNWWLRKVLLIIKSRKDKEAACWKSWWLGRQIFSRNQTIIESNNHPKH